MHADLANTNTDNQQLHQSSQKMPEANTVSPEKIETQTHPHETIAGRRLASQIKQQHSKYLDCFHKYFKHSDFMKLTNTIPEISTETLHKPMVIALKELPRKRHLPSNVTVMLKTEYPLITSLAHRYFNFKFFNKEDHFDDNFLIWIDTYVTEEFVKRLKSYQKINHFPNSCELGRKDLLSVNLKLAQNLMPDEYTFYPKTWVLPNECDLFYCQKAKDKFYIVKPHANCQGRGIYISKNPTVSRKDEVIIQEYVERPMLIEGHKFDLRIYVLLRSLSPLRIYIYKEGLCRLATTKYVRPDDKNIVDQKMHLTNYAINKNAPGFVPNKEASRESEGHKRSYTSVLKELERRGMNSKQIEERIESVVVRTIMAGYTKMLHSYKKSREQNVRYSHNREPPLRDESYNRIGDYNGEEPSVCFELLGFDIMLMENGQPLLIEINHQPSLVTDSPFDLTLKKCLLIDTINLLSIDQKDKEVWQKCQSQGTIYKNQNLEQSELENMGGFKRVYPATDCEVQSQRSERLQAKKLVYQTILNRFLFNEYKKLHKIKLSNYKTISYRPSIKQKKDKKIDEADSSLQKGASTSEERRSTAQQQRAVALTFFSLFNESKLHVKRNAFRKPKSIDNEDSDSYIKNHIGGNQTAEDDLPMKKNVTLQRKAAYKQEENINSSLEKTSFNLQRVYLKRPNMCSREEEKKSMENWQIKNRGIMHYVSAESKRNKTNNKIIGRIMDKLNPESQLQQAMVENQHSQKPKMLHVMPAVNRSDQRQTQSGERTCYLRQKYGVSIREKLQRIQNIKTMKSQIKKFSFNNFLHYSSSKHNSSEVKAKLGFSQQKTIPSSG